jgi:hypothetical protein
MWSIFLVHAGSSAAPAGAIFPPTILVQGNGIMVLGLFSTPVPCYTFAGHGSKRFNRVTFKLIARPFGQGCVDSVATVAYQAARPLPPGSYEVEVIHEYAGTHEHAGTASSTVVSKATVVVR